MFTYNPAKRITAYDALHHPWFDSLDKSRYANPDQCACLLEETGHWSNEANAPMSWSEGRRERSTSRDAHTVLVLKGPRHVNASEGGKICGSFMG